MSASAALHHLTSEVPGSPAAWQLALGRPPLLFKPGEEIYAQGEKAEKLYQVEFGAVRVYRLLADGRRQISSFHLPGEVFGFEVDVVHHFFADAIGTTGLRARRRAGGSDITSEIMDHALQCLVRTQEHLLVVGRQNAVERIAAFLLDMAERQGGLEQFDLPMSRTDIGDYLGLTIETVSRVFSKFRTQGIIELASVRTLKILKRETLQVLSE
ncbi:MAG: cyclic nucleotide-binding domain-containing protein [Mesorhizobium sp.]|uniref:helix-turn-helix domain-containing protein n=1 Tax=unclassified Mesorhizobium TaxID=325217 RepID=UPI000FCA86EC|nr:MULTISPECIES: helix-turn-helix domain-containing protein [unclassified Mesorhizobium]RUV73225.1 cyclic nucleotide-binding domain-containing protein [Mesorhizobium sp. M5C.F.Cr.IN.023.01.1.1]RWF86648.1 MAG: cyclic nucleotide-binding domain-containing protein [Mesorhizobium sp.]RWF95391.1 MAG: cyclic nucleotide-binding domain-containing protein [Mesorhizobium sp.]RWI39771.1 MAG: cyclic nucleotide-binding domain-containing protein [Mesorhizobium sp.]RWI45362.1 MAG: cyclic nucleotide-binding do